MVDERWARARVGGVNASESAKAVAKSNASETVLDDIALHKGAAAPVAGANAVSSNTRRTPEAADSVILHAPPRRCVDAYAGDRTVWLLLLTSAPRISQPRP